MAKKADRTKAQHERAGKVKELKAALKEFDDDLDDESRAEIISRVWGYSERNALLIAMQRPDATEVHGFRAWLGLGRSVRKGEQGIQILAPAGRREKDENDPNSTERQFFRIAFVFDIRQTDKLPKPE